MTASFDSPCTLCHFTPSFDRPACNNEVWECTHLGCPHRHPITAAPSDQPPQPSETDE